MERDRRADEDSSPVRRTQATRSRRTTASAVGLLVLGIVAGQLILYGASFTGAKILLPLDILTLPGNYIPSGGHPVEQPHNEYASDPVFEDEPARLFRHSELKAGRLPMWNPYQYAGVPSMSFLSPFAILGALVRTPRILPWLSLAAALISGFGAYSFARRVLGVGSWPAIVAGWCYPVTAFFVLWQSYSLAYPIVWMPWILCATDHVISRSSRWAVPALALTTMLTLLSGHLDMAGLVLIVAGLFAVWSLARTRAQGVRIGRRGALVICGWVLGFMLASAELPHALEYARTGARLSGRGHGHEERPPIGLVSLPQLVMPHLYGTIERGSLPIVPKKEANIIETPAAGFAGIIATLVLAPLALAHRRHRAIAIFLVALGLLGMAWCLNIWGAVWLMRLPGINLLPYNRFVFVTAFAITSLAAIGLDVANDTSWHRWYYIPMAILAGLAGWCLVRTFNLPPTIAQELPRLVAAGRPLRWIHEMTEVYRVQQWFRNMYLTGTVVSVIGLLIWIAIRLEKTAALKLSLFIGITAVAELLWFGHGRAAQCDPSLYYPRISQLEEVAGRPAGRVLGYNALPAALLQTQGLLDVRGYDGVDPARCVELLDLARQPGSTRLDYATVQYYVPRVADASLPGSVELPPVLDLLGVRYLVCLTADYSEYFILVNNKALPRVFVPSSVELENDREARLAKLASPSFQPHQLAYVEGGSDYAVPGRGEVNITDSNPQRLEIQANMTQAGLIVLADQWNDGWRAFVDNKSIPIVRVDHALRGVIAPMGASTIVFRYQPRSWIIGLVIAGVAMLIILTSICLPRRSSVA